MAAAVQTIRQELQEEPSVQGTEEIVTPDKFAEIKEKFPIEPDYNYPTNPTKFREAEQERQRRTLYELGVEIYGDGDYESGNVGDPIVRFPAVEVEDPSIGGEDISSILERLTDTDLLQKIQEDGNGQVLAKLFNIVAIDHRIILMPREEYMLPFINRIGHAIKEGLLRGYQSGQAAVQHIMSYPSIVGDEIQLVQPPITLVSKRSFTDAQALLDDVSLLFDDCPANAVYHDSDAKIRRVTPVDGNRWLIMYSNGPVGIPVDIQDYWNVTRAGLGLTRMGLQYRETGDVSLAPESILVSDEVLHNQAANIAKSLLASGIF